MTEHADTSPHSRRPPSPSATFVTAHAFWLTVGTISLAAGAFLPHQLMAWPPHEDETLALFVGRDSLAGVLEHVTRERGGAPLHFLFAWAVAHLGFGLGGMRLVSASFAVASLPLVALLGRRLADRRSALIATALVAAQLGLPLPRRLRADVQPLPVPLAPVVPPPAPRSRPSGVVGLGRLGSRLLLGVAAHPYGALVFASQAVFVLLARRDQIRRAAVAFVVVGVAGIPFWITDLVLANRFDVGVGGRGSKLGGPWAIVTYLWQTAGDFSTGRWPVLAIVLVLGLVGLVVVRNETRVARPLRDRRARGGISRGASRRLDLARIAPSHLRAPVLRDRRRAPESSAARERAPAAAIALTAVLVVLEVGWAWNRTPQLFEWEPNKRQATRAQAEEFLATTSRPDDLLFGYEPLYLGAWERNRAFSDVVVPRADSALALRTIRRQPRPLGRGVWILDASERNNLRPRLEIENRDPGPAGTFETRAFGPFLVIRTIRPVGDDRAYFAAAARAMLVGRSLGIGDADVNLQTIERADRVLRGYGPSLRLLSDTSR